MAEIIDLESRRKAGQEPTAAQSSTEFPPHVVEKLKDNMAELTMHADTIEQHSTAIQQLAGELISQYGDLTAARILNHGMETVHRLLLERKASMFT